MRSGLWLGVLAALLLGVTVWAEEGGGKKHGKKGEAKGLLPTVEEIEAKLDPDKLTDDQKTKIVALREDLLKQWADLAAKDEVKKAQEEMDKAKTAEDKDAMRTARAKFKEVTGGFNVKTKFKDGLSKILTEAQVAKLLPPAKHEGKEGGKPEEGKKE